MKRVRSAREMLIRLRTQRKLKQRQVASSLGITTSYYGMIEQGVRTPSLKTSKKIADFYGVNVEEIFFTSTNNSMLSDYSYGEGGR